MANDGNLIPFNKRTENEQREIQSSGGRASGESRRRKAALRDTMNRLLTMHAEVAGLSDILLADGGDSTYEEIITIAMIKKAAMGDVSAYTAIKSTVGQTDKSESDLEEQQIRTDRARRARDQEQGITDNSDGIQSFLNAMRPTDDEMNSLFETECEEADHAEKAEETSDI